MTRVTCGVDGRGHRWWVRVWDLLRHRHQQHECHRTQHPDWDHVGPHACACGVMWW